MPPPSTRSNSSMPVVIARGARRLDVGVEPRAAAGRRRRSGSPPRAARLRPPAPRRTSSTRRSRGSGPATSGDCDPHSWQAKTVLGGFTVDAALPGPTGRSIIDPLDPGADAAQQLVRNRARSTGHLADGDLVVALPADDHDLVAGLDASMPVTSTVIMSMQTDPTIGRAAPAHEHAARARRGASRGRRRSRPARPPSSSGARRVNRAAVADDLAGPHALDRHDAAAQAHDRLQRRPGPRAPAARRRTAAGPGRTRSNHVAGRRAAPRCWRRAAGSGARPRPASVRRRASKFRRCAANSASPGTSAVAKCV